MHLQDAPIAGEEWRPVAELPHLYEASSFGRIRSLDRIDSKGRLRKGRVLAPIKAHKEYRRVCLKVGGKPLHRWIHRLVAFAFVPNPRGLNQVNHIDGNPANNVASNLEWVSPSENTNHAYRVLRKNIHPVYGISLKDGERIDFLTLTDAQAAGFQMGNVGACIRGKKRTYKGYVWFTNEKLRNSGRYPAIGPLPGEGS